MDRPFARKSAWGKNLLFPFLNLAQQIVFNLLVWYNKIQVSGKAGYLIALCKEIRFCTFSGFVFQVPSLLFILHFLNQDNVRDIG